MSIECTPSSGDNFNNQSAGGNFFETDVRNSLTEGERGQDAPFLPASSTPYLNHPPPDKTRGFLPKYSFETARLFLPEERKTYCVTLSAWAGDLSQKLTSLTSENHDSVSNQKIPYGDLADFLRYVRTPVDQKLFEKVNELAETEGREVLSWADVRKLYSVKNSREIETAIRNLEDDCSPENLSLLINEISTFKQGVDEFVKLTGGDSDETLVNIVNKYVVGEHSDWHRVLFDHVEKALYARILTEIMKRFRVDVGEIVTDDRGCGEGRCLHQLHEVLEKGFFDYGVSLSPQPADEILHFLSNYHGIDIDTNKICAARDMIFGLMQVMRRQISKNTVFAPVPENLFNGFSDMTNLEECNPKAVSGRSALAERADGMLLDKVVWPEPADAYFTEGDYLCEEELYDPDNLETGNFNAQEPHGKERHSPGSVHFEFSMMRTLLHSITERRLYVFLKKLSEDLAPGTEQRAGGMMLLDTVLFKDFTNPTPDQAARFTDLRHFYFQLVSAYRRRYQPLLPEDIEMERMPRFPIYDNTTGQGFYWREVVTPEYIEYIIKKYDLNLCVSRKETSAGDLFSKPLEASEKEEWTQLGRSWIKANGLEDYYRGVINTRLKQGNVSSDLQKQITANPDSNPMKIILNDIAYSMIADFRSDYIILERPKKPPKAYRYDEDGNMSSVA